MDSILSNHRLIEPKGVFPVGSSTIGGSDYRGWKLGDASCFGWPNQAFKALDMCGNAWACWSWGPKRALMASDKRKPRRCPIFRFPLLELPISLGWGWSVKA